MKRFILMAGEHYYPSGGFGDFHSDWETEEEAFGQLRSWVRTQARTYYDERTDETVTYKESVWAHIYDLQERKIVWSWDGDGGIWLSPKDNEVEDPSDESVD